MKTTMKTTMKFFAALAIMMGFTMGAMAQTGNITANATVAVKVAVTAPFNLNFGLVAQGTTKIIALTGTPSLTGESKGQFHIVKGPNTQVTLDLTGLTNLTNTVAEVVTPLTTSYTARLSGVGATLPTITPAAGVASYPVSAGDYFVAPAFDVDLGGSVTAGESQITGLYTGSITLTATYN